MMNVYFDNSATTKPDPEVLATMIKVLESYYGNPSSLHELGVEAEKLILKAKEVCAQQLQVKASEIIFTSGGTESNNLAIKGIAWGYRERGQHIITSQIEHSSVYDVCQELERNFGFEITYLPVDKNGVISVLDVQAALRKDTILVTLMHVNNELGSVQPIKEIGEWLKKTQSTTYFHVDQVQGFGKVPLSLKSAGVDLATVSGHKLHAPKGTGLLYVHERIRQLYPMLHGGAQQNRLRPGTENVAGIVGLAKAMRIVGDKQIEQQQHLWQLKRRCIDILSEIKGVHVHSSLEERISAPHIVNASFIGIKPEVLLHALEDKGIYVSTKSACSSKSDQPSRILLATGMDHDQARSAIRISFSAENTLAEVEYFGQMLHEIIPYLQKILKV